VRRRILLHLIISCLSAAKALFGRASFVRGLAATFESPTPHPLWLPDRRLYTAKRTLWTRQTPQSWLILSVPPRAYLQERREGAVADGTLKYRKSASRASRSPSARAPPSSTATARSPRPPSSTATSRAPRTTLPVRTRSSPQQTTHKKRTPAHHRPHPQKEVSTR